MNKKIAIIGAGGHGKVIGEIALLNQYDIVDFYDDKINEIKNFPFNISGNVEDLKNKFKNYDSFFVAIGNNYVRSDYFDGLKKQNANIVSLIHPKSTISKFCVLGKGICVMANAVINTDVLIKDGVIINTSASIDHDCLIEDFSHISPNCSLSGNVKVGKFTHLGTGTAVHPDITIGDNVRAGIGSRIYKNVVDKEVIKNN